MATLSSVVVDFIANTAKYVSGLTDMSNKTKKWSNDVKKDVAGLENVFKSFSSGGVGAGTQSLFNLVKGASAATAALASVTTGLALGMKAAIDSASALSDLAERFSFTTKEAQLLQSTFEKSGVSLEEVGAFSEKLSRSSLEAADGNEKLATTFAKLGIEVDSFNKLTASQRVDEFAKSLAAVKDPAEQARIAFELGGKASSKLLAGLRDIGENGIDAKQIFTNTPELIKELDTLGDRLTSSTTEFKRWGLEAFGYVAKLINGFIDLNAQTKNSNPPNWFKMGGVGMAENQKEKTTEQIDAERKRAEENTARIITANRLQNEVFQKQIDKYSSIINVASAYKIELQKIDEETKKLLKDQYDQVKIQEILSVKAERITAVTKKYNETLGDRNAILGAIDNGAKYQIELKKLNETIDDFNKKQDQAGRSYNKITDIERIKLTSDLQNSIDKQKNSILASIDPSEKYAQAIDAVKKITDSYGRGLKQSQIDTYIYNLGSAYRAIIDPASKYYELQRDLDAQVKNGIITDEGKTKVLNDLGQAYREAYDPAAKLLKIVQDLNALPAGSNVDKVKYLQSLGENYKKLIDPQIEFKKQLEEIDALSKPVTLTTKRAFPYRDQIQQVQILSNTQAEAAKKVLNDEKKINESKQAALLLDDKKLIAQAEYEQTLFNIDRLFAGQAQTQEILTQKLEMQRIASAKLYSETSPYFKELAQFGENFASGLAMAISEGQNFSSALSDVFKSVLKQIEVMILRTLILQSIFQAIGLATGGVQSNAATGFAKMVGLQGRASGGSVNANNPYLVGENGPEMFVPSSNGVILPNDFQGEAPVNVYQTINVSAGVSQTVRAEMIGLLPRFKQEAMMGVIDAKQRGGSYARSLAS